MKKAFLKIITFSVLAVLVFSLVPMSEVFASQTHVSISVSPNELAQAGNVTVTIGLRNTNSAPITTQPPEETPDPGDNPGSAPSPIGSDSFSNRGSYTDITISNAYGVSFNTSGVVLEPGNNTTFTGTMYVTDELIGVTLTFTVSWTDGGERKSESVTTIVKRRNVSPYLTVARTASPATAAPGTTVTFKYTFTNTGSVTLVNIELTDRYVYGSSNVMHKIAQLDPGASEVFTFVLHMGSSSVVSSPVVKFYAYGGTTQLVVNVASMTIGLINSQLTKEVVVGTSTPDGVQFTIYLTNNGNLRLNNLKITDELGNSVSSEGFSLAVGEQKVIEHFVPNPEEVRYVVFYIRGTVSGGADFRDNTESFTVRPYIDKSHIGLSFTAVTTSSMNDENVIGLEFSVENTGLEMLYDLSLTEQQIGYEMKKWETLAPGASDNVQLDANIGEVRDLVFVLTAKDSSGNEYTWEAHVTAEQIDVSSSFPYHDPSVNGGGGIGIVDDDTGLGKKLDGLITDTGRKLQKWFRVLGIVAGAAAVSMLALGIAEIVIRRNRRSGGKKTEQ